LSIENELIVFNKDFPLFVHSIANLQMPPGLQPYVAPATSEFKNRLASEILGVDYDNIDKGSLPSRLNGVVGGTMVKTYTVFSEAVLAYMYWRSSNKT